MTPERIQRKRTKGWTKPEGAVNCTRPGKWGNPFEGPDAVERFERAFRHPPGIDVRVGVDASLADTLHLGRIHYDIHELRDAKYLMCWCPLDQPCHVDTIIELLRLANEEPSNE